YVGVGYEFLWSGVGVAVESAWRRSFLQNDIEVTSFTPSIGLQFYEMSLF
ncbi:MAG: hypothetical protein HRT44_05690, partial [Bdellovibrionales bacterium]|nr:hypothetical protein [Bdellovibrionales bacterium]